MSRDEIEALWAELNSLRDELETLTTKRTMLVNHLEELNNLGAELETSHANVERMAHEVRQHLAGGGTDEN